MQVCQALIAAGGKGTRLGMGSKSHIVYRGKLLLEYCVRACIDAGIGRIVITVPPLGELPDERSRLADQVLAQHPGVRFVRDNHSSFRNQPEIARDFLDTTKPFYLLGGHNPQSPEFLKSLAALYRPNSMVMSAYTYKYDSYVISASVESNRVIACSGSRLEGPEELRAEGRDRLLLFPAILDYRFYDGHVKSDTGKALFQLWPGMVIESGGSIYCLDNPLPAEVDYERDLKSLYDSIDQVFPYESAAG